MPFKVRDKIRRGFAKRVRYVEQDLRRMERIQADVQWLNQRDSNCDAAASLTDSIDVLITEAIRMHREELKELKRGARTGKL